MKLLGQWEMTTVICLWQIYFLNVFRMKYYNDQEKYDLYQGVSEFSYCRFLFSQIKSYSGIPLYRTERALYRFLHGLAGKALSESLNVREHSLQVSRRIAELLWAYEIGS